MTWVWIAVSGAGLLGAIVGAVGGVAFLWLAGWRILPPPCEEDPWRGF